MNSLRHHRLKTHGGWTYTTLEPGTYLWASPHRYQYLRETSPATGALRHILRTGSHPHR